MPGYLELRLFAITKYQRCLRIHPGRQYGKWGSANMKFGHKYCCPGVKIESKPSKWAFDWKCMQ